MTADTATDWLFDLGNSRLKCAPWRDGVLGPMHFIEHDGKAFAAGWERQLPGRIAVARIASVAAPALADALGGMLARRSDHIDIARTLATCAGVRIAYAQPQRLGVDRFLTLLAARARTSTPALIVGVGTALTIDLLDGDGLHRGGRIAPSPDFMRAMLHARASHLPASGGSYDEFATDTIDALASGCEGAALGLIQRSRDAAVELLGDVPQLLMHGGGAAALQPRLPDATPAPSLVLEGLAQWARAGD